MTVSARKKILVVDDEQDILALLDYNLEKEGYRVLRALDGQQAIKIAKHELPDLIVLDLMLPVIDGLEVCQILKQSDQTKNIPILMLTAKSEESDVIVGLQLGADDYVTKPFSPKVLLARIKAILRRFLQKQKTDTLRNFGKLTIDIPKHKITYKSKPIELTAIEFNILEFLSRYPGRVFSRDQIMDNVWREGKFIIDRAVDVHIRGLRKKLKNAADFIETVRGVGYRFKDNEETDV